MPVVLAHTSLVSQLVGTRQFSGIQLRSRRLTMSDARMLFLIRTFHTTIYLILAVSVVFLLVAALLGYFGPLLLVALLLISIEVIVFVASGMKCPLTDLAKKYGAEKGYAFDTFLPEALTKYTFRFFGVLLVLGLILLALRLIR